MRGIQIVMKLMNCDLTYENGVCSPFNKLYMKDSWVKVCLRKVLTSESSPFFLKEELNNTVLNKFSN